MQVVPTHLNGRLKHIAARVHHGGAASPTGAGRTATHGNVTAEGTCLSVLGSVSVIGRAADGSVADAVIHDHRDRGAAAELVCCARRGKPSALGELAATGEHSEAAELNDSTRNSNILLGEAHARGGREGLACLQVDRALERRGTALDLQPALKRR
eukprot:scaffold70294_cov30-Tisochrysis_lutea.AAC.6